MCFYSLNKIGIALFPVLPTYFVLLKILLWLPSKTLKITNFGEYVEKREPFLHSWWECKLGQSLWRTVWNFLKKLRGELPYDPEITLLKNMKTLMWKDTCIPVFIAALCTIAKIWKCLSRDERIKMWYTIEYFLSHKTENEILPFAAMGKDLGIIMPSEISQIKTNIIWYHLNVKSKKWKQMCMQNRNRLTDIENKCGYQWGEGTGEGRDRGMGLRDTNDYVSNR